MVCAAADTLVGSIGDGNVHDGHPRALVVTAQPRQARRVVLEVVEHILGQLRWGHANPVGRHLWGLDEEWTLGTRARDQLVERGHVQKVRCHERLVTAIDRVEHRLWSGVRAISNAGTVWIVRTRSAVLAVGPADRLVLVVARLNADIDGEHLDLDDRWCAVDPDVLGAGGCGVATVVARSERHALALSSEPEDVRVAAEPIRTVGHPRPTDGGILSALNHRRQPHGWLGKSTCARVDRGCTAHVVEPCKEPGVGIASIAVNGAVLCGTDHWGSVVLDDEVGSGVNRVAARVGRCEDVRLCAALSLHVSAEEPLRERVREGVLAALGHACASVVRVNVIAGRETWVVVRDTISSTHLRGVRSALLLTRLARLVAVDLVARAHGEVVVAMAVPVVKHGL